MSFHRFIIIPAAVLFGLVVAPRAEATVITFDEITAPCGFSGVTPGGPTGPVVAYPQVTFDSGVVMNECGWANLATTNPNLYGTSDFLTLANGSSLPGFIEGTFSSSVTTLTLDVINGFGAALFTLSAYAFEGGPLLDTDVIALAAFPGAGAVGSLSVAASGIGYFTVTSNQASFSKDFAIDTVEFNQVPEPASLLLFGTGIAALVRRRLRARH